MKNYLSILRHRWRGFRYPPVVVIDHSGQLTARPQVHVSVEGIRGLQGVYSWDADTQGEARATLYGRGLADIVQRRLIDKRQNTELFVHCYEKTETPYRCQRCNSAQLGCTPEVCNYKYPDVSDDMPLRQLGDEE